MGACSLLKFSYLFLFVVVEVSGTKYNDEVNLEEFRGSFDKKISEYGLSKFVLPDEKDEVFEKLPYCKDYTVFTGPEKSCKVSFPKQSGQDYRFKTKCNEQKCVQRSYFGSTKCTEIVPLHKPFFHVGIQCRYSNLTCNSKGELDNNDENKELYPKPPKKSDTDPYPKPTSANGDKHVYPKPTTTKSNADIYPRPGEIEVKKPEPENNMILPCKCMTIWCFRDIETIYKKEGHLYVGYVKLKVPCGCDCRMVDYDGGYGSY